MTMIELIDRSAPPWATRTSAVVGHRWSWRRTAKVSWLLLNAAAMLEGTRGSLEAGGLSEDDRHLRAQYRLRSCRASEL